jgi:DNA repair protein RadC
MKQILVLKELTNKIRSPSDIFKNIKKIKIDYDKEHFIVITLNTKSQVINAHIIGIGILNASLIHPRETFKKAILDSAHSIIVCHNHPSGDLHPSSEDIEITEKLKSAGKILGILVLDHIIFNKTEFYSINNEGGL